MMFEQRYQAGAVRLISLSGAAALCGAMSLAAVADELPQVSIHDPVMAEEQGTYYLFSTGPGITIYRSSDRQRWQLDGHVFDPEPDWAREVVPDFAGHLWAPDIIERDGRFYLYYSVSAFGRNTSAIGVATNTTLDADSPDYAWRDQGVVLQSVPNRDLWNAIDPHIIVDEQDTPWMSFGSFWGGIKLVQLADNMTELAEPQQWYSLAKRERPAFIPDDHAGPADIEAPFIFQHDDYYYLFVSYGKCCQGKDSTYHMAVGRSENVQGPYVDRQGIDMAAGGGTVILEGNDEWYGVGHNSIYRFDDQDYLVFHAYDAADQGLQKLKIAEVEWSDGWPTVDSAALGNYQSELVDAD
ncbi:arabinan endo-1,5-alpha-L-arabinosidase [Halomonas elongata]|uniref:arabinan endo-1,5-alpha-L-arabinosidase n=1 Tax=Halomonas elongata TaxID=2746 RepID=UPI00255ABF2F|nr:arabinan endo-1,5-alpha-L-arabinosidase [Halomonas elongata]MDL4863671.1 arabinan endo-1,5-alpha-L-arabinosidase [Halomonas elongata]